MEILTHWLAPASMAALGAIVALVADAFGARRVAAVSVILGATGAAKLGVLAALSLGSETLPESALSPVVGILVAVFALMGAAAVAGGWRTLVNDERGGRTSVLAGLAISSALLAMSTSDLVVLFAALEGMALAAYGLVALGGTDRSREAAMKYFVQGAVATGLLLVGVAVLFAGTAGNLSYGTILSVPGTFPSRALLLAWTLVTVGLAFKAGAFPFHSWAPDAYETASSPAAGLMASVVKGAAVTVLAGLATVRVTLGVEGGDTGTAVIVAVIAAGSIVFGNFAALRQRSLKRMLAYSGIAQVGYALIGVVTGNAWTTVLLMMVYAPAALGAFLVAEAVGWERPDWDGSIEGLSGLARRRPALAAALAAVMLSLTGVPLFAGFWGKLGVFLAAASGGWVWLAILGAVGSVVSFGYYGAVLRSAYMTDADGPPAGERAGRAASAVAVGLAMLVVAFGVAPLLTGTRWIGLILGG